MTKMASGGHFSVNGNMHIVGDYLHIITLRLHHYRVKEVFTRDLVSVHRRAFTSRLFSQEEFILLEC